MGDPVAILNHDKRIQLPCHALFVGASMSGKTRLAFRLCQPDMFVEQPKRVLILYQMFQPLYNHAKEKLESAGVDVQLKRGHEIQLDQVPADTLVIIDDAFEETAASKEVARIATAGRHKSVSLWLIWHSLYSRHPNSRVTSQSMGLYFLLPSPRLGSQLRTFGSQLGFKNRLLSAYEQIVNDPDGEHRYILVDLTPNVPDLLRIRSHIHCLVQHCYH